MIDYEKEVENAGSITQAAKKLGIPYSTFNDRLKSSQKKERMRGMSSKEILEKFNHLDKVMSIINSLPDDDFIKDLEIISSAGISKVTWKRCRVNEKIQRCCVRLPDGSFVYGKPDDAINLRKLLLEV